MEIVRRWVLRLAGTEAFVYIVATGMFVGVPAVILLFFLGFAGWKEAVALAIPVVFVILAVIHQNRPQ